MYSLGLAWTCVPQLLEFGFNWSSVAASIPRFTAVMQGLSPVVIRNFGYEYIIKAELLTYIIETRIPFMQARTCRIRDSLDAGLRVVLTIYFKC